MCNAVAREPWLEVEPWRCPGGPSHHQAGSYSQKGQVPMQLRLPEVGLATRMLQTLFCLAIPPTRWPPRSTPPSSSTRIWA